MKEAEGPIIVWENLGYEGWHPKSFVTIKEALLATRYSSEFVLTRLIEFDVLEKQK